MLDQALDTAEALGQDPHLRAGDEVDGLLLGLDEERDHAAEVAHLARCDRVSGVVREPRVEHVGHARVILEERDHGAGVLAVLTHPDGERLEATQHEPGIERAGDGAERLLQEPEPFRDRGVVRGDESADHVGVAAEVLRRRVDDDVRAELERLLEVRRREGVVDHEEGAGGMRRVGCGAEVDDVQQRVRG